DRTTSEIDRLRGVNQLNPDHVAEIVDDSRCALDGRRRVGGNVFHATRGRRHVGVNGRAELTNLGVEKEYRQLHDLETDGAVAGGEQHPESRQPGALQAHRTLCRRRRHTLERYGQRLDSAGPRDRFEVGRGDHGAEQVAVAYIEG